MERLSFDVNVALRGGCVEVAAQREAGAGGGGGGGTTSGQTTNRQQALKLIYKARADVIEMEDERQKRIR